MRCDRRMLIADLVALPMAHTCRGLFGTTIVAQSSSIDETVNSYCGSLEKYYLSSKRVRK